MKILRYLFLTFLISTKLFSNELLDEFAKPLTIPTTRNLFISGTLLSASMIYIDRDFDKHNQREMSKHIISKNLCKYGNDYGQIVPNIAYFLINATMGLSMENGTLYQKRAIDMLYATSFSGIVTDVLKPIINERRPNGGSNSYPSGHSTSAFAFASYIALEHEWYYGLAAYLSAMSVGYSRIATNAHYPHDVVAGATIGMSYGMAQYYKNYLSTLAFTPMILPTENADGIKFLVLKEF